jgi:porphobilinogen deaminase
VGNCKNQTHTTPARHRLDGTCRCPVGVAAVVSAKSAAWTQAAAAIERIRVGAKMGIDAATDQAGIDAVIAGMNPWPVP